MKSARDFRCWAKEKYPDTPTRKGVPFEGIENLRPKSLVYQDTVRKTQNVGK